MAPDVTLGSIPSDALCRLMHVVDVLIKGRPAQRAEILNSMVSESMEARQFRLTQGSKDARITLNDVEAAIKKVSRS